VLWWVIPVGLFIEYLILKPVLSYDWIRTAKIVISANIVSAIVGLIVSYPITFYEPSLDLLLEWLNSIEHEKTFFDTEMFMIAFFSSVFILNVVIELFFSKIIFEIKISLKSGAGYIVANILSFIVVLYGAAQLLEESMKPVI
jgi:hypothetical protein